MKILHLHTELNLACGITRTITQIVSYSPKSSIHYIISLGGNALNRFEIFNDKLNVFTFNRNTISGTLNILFALFTYCKKNSVQIVHSHHRYFDTLIWILKPFLKIKTITSVQSKVSGIKLFSYKADRLIACSGTIKKHLIEFFNIDERRIKVVFNVVDSKSISISQELKQFKMSIGIELDKFVIGFIGRIDFAEKGVDILLDAFNELSISNPNIHLLLIGDGANNQEVKSFCDLHKTNTTFLTSKENIFDYYNLMDLVVLPSRVDPFPLTMIESGYMNRPFIGSNVDGIPELISNEENGLLFESGNVEELKTQIARIYNDRKFGEKLAENLHKKVLDSFTVDKIIPQYEKLYSELLVE
ncbi:MAG: glycosyltransferase family 4 protein [Ignavibacteriaceae bacterium]